MFRSFHELSISGGFVVAGKFNDKPLTADNLLICLDH